MPQSATANRLRVWSNRSQTCARTRAGSSRSCNETGKWQKAEFRSKQDLFKRRCIGFTFV